LYPLYNFFQLNSESRASACCDTQWGGNLQGNALPGDFLDTGQQLKCRSAQESSTPDTRISEQQNKRATGGCFFPPQLCQHNVYFLPLQLLQPRTVPRPFAPGCSTAPCSLPSCLAKSQSPPARLAGPDTRTRAAIPVGPAGNSTGMQQGSTGVTSRPFPVHLKHGSR